MTTVADPEMETDDKIPFTAHLEELRKRLITCFIAVGVGFALSYGFKEKLLRKMTIQELINQYHEEDIHLIVEHNGRFVYPNEYAITVVTEGDRVEFINPNFGG